MRNLFKSSMFIAAAAVAFAGCTKEDTGNVSEATGNKITVSANAYAPETETRTVIGDKTEQGTYPVYWSAENEALAIVEFADNTRGAAIKTGEYTLSEDKKNANFQFELTENASASAFDYYALYPYSVWSEDISTTKEYITLRFPSAQTPSATSADPNASVLFAKDMGHSVQPTTMNFSFQHVAAYSKMTITGLPLGSGEVVKSVTFSSTGKDLAGTYRYYHETPESNSVVGSNSNSITTNVEALAIDGTQDFTIWFACLPTTIDATFSVSVQTDANIYTREVTVPSDRPLEFVAGQVSTFGVDMSSAGQAKDYTGTYVILVNKDNTYYALSSTNQTSATRLDAIKITYNGTDETIITDNQNIVWDIAKSGSSYTLSNGGLFLSWPGNNEAEMSQNEYLLDIKANDNGSVAITSNSAASRKLQKNQSTEYFAFYESAQIGDLYLVPALITPIISLNVESITLEYNDETMYDFNVTVTKASSVEVAAYNDAEGTAECTWLYAEYENGMVSYFATEPNNTDAARTAYIVISASNEIGTSKKTVMVRQNNQGGSMPETVSYKVTSTKAVSTSGVAPDGSSAAYSQTYNTTSQITSGNNAVLTLSGFAGKKITSVVLSMKSNSSKGAGKFSMVAGATELAAISSATDFNKWYDNNRFGTDYRDVNVELTNSDYTIASGEDVVITITATTNSLYIESYTITYE